MPPDETRYHHLKLLEANPDATQRKLASAMGVSVGKTHYVLRGLIAKGFVKANNFRRSDNKRAYLYKLTPAGVTEKLRITRRYLADRQAKYERIRMEVESLQTELEEQATRAMPE